MDECDGGGNVDGGQPGAVLEGPRIDDLQSFGQCDCIQAFAAGESAGLDACYSGRNGEVAAFAGRIIQEGALLLIIQYALFRAECGVAFCNIYGGHRAASRVFATCCFPICYDLNDRKVLTQILSRARNIKI